LVFDIKEPWRLARRRQTPKADQGEEEHSCAHNDYECIASASVRQCSFIDTLPGRPASSPITKAPTAKTATRPTRMAVKGAFIGSGESVEQARGKPQAPALLSIVARLLL
jgi:hypothetical protein